MGDRGHQNVADLCVLHGERATIGTATKPNKYGQGCDQTQNMRGVGVDVHHVRRGEIGVSDQPGEEENGPTAQKCGQIDPIQGFKPVHFLDPVLAAVGAHGVEGVNANGR